MQICVLLWSFAYRDIIVLRDDVIHAASADLSILVSRTLSVLGYWSINE